MKINLVFPPPSEGYRDIIWSNKGIPAAPQTAPAELGAYVRKYAGKQVEISAINPIKSDGNSFSVRTNEEIAELCKDSDLVGFTCLYSNQESALDIARLIKHDNPKTKVVLGGHNVSNNYMANNVLERSEIDYVVLYDGEDALLGLVNGVDVENIPNLAYVEKAKKCFNQTMPVNLNKIPSWDFEDSLDAKVILEAGYDHRTDLYQKIAKEVGRTPGEIGVFSRRGCAKASGEIGNRRGYCTFCTSAGDKKTSVMSAENFWKQVKSLYETYGIQDLFIADNIFGLNLREVNEFGQAKERIGVSDDINFRAYSYPSLLLGKDGKAIAQGLRSLGVTNIFLGVETFSPEVALLSNKEHVTPNGVNRAIEVLSSSGIDTFLALMLGLPGESHESLRNNRSEFERLIKTYGSKRLGSGNLVRLDISPAMPLVGTSWFMKLKGDERVRKDYFRETGRELSDELFPDFNELRRLNLKYFGNATEEELLEVKDYLTNVSLKHFHPSVACGAFDFRKSPS